MDKILKLVDKEIKCIEDSESLNEQQLMALDKLVDIKKDIYEIYEKEDEDEMKYDRYGARRRDSRGRYMEGRMTRYDYRLPDYFGRMQDGYDDYTAGMERYRSSGSYGDHDKGMEALEYMLESVVDFVEYLHDNADSPEETELIKKYVHKMKEM